MKNQNTQTQKEKPISLKDAVLQALENITDQNYSSQDILAEIKSSLINGEYTLVVSPTHAAVKTVIENEVPDEFHPEYSKRLVGNNYVFSKIVTVTSQVPNGVTVIPEVQVAPPVVDNDIESPVHKKIDKYLDKQTGPVLLKKLQSALKINGLSCRDYVTILTEMGHVPSPGVDVESYSMFTVQK